MFQYYNSIIVLTLISLQFIRFSCSVSTNEINALQSIYNSTQGYYWNWRSLDFGMIWNFSDSPTPCLWQGISCNNENITEISLKHYSLIGELPNVFDLLPNITALSFSFNKISGTLPTSILSLYNLQSLEISNNNITGNLTDFLDAKNSSGDNAILALTQLQRLDVGFNELEGVFPAIIGQITTLGHLILSSNRLIGTVPTQYKNLNYLTDLYASHNKMTGSLPADLFENMKLIRLINFARNSITGSLPSSLGKSSCRGIYLANNVLSGSIPSSWENLINLNELDISENSITGQFPPIFPEMLTLLINDNQFSGSVPTYVGGMSRLDVLQISSNSFEGRFPESIRQSASVRTLLIQDNFFEGGVSNMFDPTVQTKLSVIDMSNNAFSGGMDGDMFRLPSLSTFIMVDNCMDGDIPTDICDASHLRTLALDGMTTGCQSHLVPFFSRTIFAKIDLGSIPACLFTLPKLHTLHVSGNGYSGKLPSTYNQSILKDLTLSFNRLSGTIPNIIRNTDQVAENSFSVLDISHNRIAGTASNMFAPPNLHMEVNRLSGVLDDSMENVINLNVVEGNLFSCFRIYTTAANDPNISKYTCGSSVLDMVLMVFGLSFVMVTTWAFIVCGYCQLPEAQRDEVSDAVSSESRFHLETSLYYCKELYNSLMSLEEFERTASNVTCDIANVKRFVRYMFELRWMCSALSAIALLAFMPLYMGLKWIDDFDSSYNLSTMSYQYGWFVSAAYLNGPLPAALLFCIWTYVTLSTYHFGHRIRYDINMYHASNQSDSNSDGSVMIRGDSSINTFDKELMNHIMMEESISICEVHEDGTTTRRTRGSYSSSISSMKQSRGRSMASFRSSSSSLLVQDHSFVEAQWVRGKYLAKSLTYVLIPVGNCVLVLFVNICYVYVLVTQNRENGVFVQFALAIVKMLWNSVLLPYFLHSAHKFENNLNGIMTERDLSVHVYLLIFNLVLAPVFAAMSSDSNCFEELFDPPEPITTTFVYEGCGIAGVSVNCATSSVVGTEQTTFQPPYIYQYDCASAILKDYVPVYISVFLILGLWLPVAKAILMYCIHTYPVKMEEYRAYIPEIYYHVGLGRDRTLNLKANRLFNASNVVCSMISYFAVLVSFGIAYPPLAVIIALSIYVNSLQWQYVIQHVLAGFPDYKGGLMESETVGSMLQYDCLGVWKVFYCSMWPLLVLIACFAAGLLFDMIGDKENLTGKIALICVMLFVPTMLRIFLWVKNLRSRYVKYNERRSKNRSVNSMGVDMSLLRSHLPNVFRSDDTECRVTDSTDAVSLDMHDNPIHTHHTKEDTDVNEESTTTVI